MATVREKYNNLREGKINSKQFMEFVRKDENLKNIVSPLQSFKDTVIVLTKKNIVEGNYPWNKINEDDMSVGDDFDPQSLIPKDSEYDRFMNEIDNILREKGLDDDSIEEIFSTYPKLIKGGFDVGDTPHDVIRTLLSLSNDYNTSMNDLNEDDERANIDQDFTKNNNYAHSLESYKFAVAHFLEKLGAEGEEAKDAVIHFINIVEKNYKSGIDCKKTATVIFNLANKDWYDNGGDAQFNELLNENFDWIKLDQENINPNSFAQGWKYEYKLQKVKDIDKAKEKSESNLVKNPLHYINLLAGVKDKKKRTDLPVEVDKKMSNTTDKLNATKVNTPNAKASAHKAREDKHKKIKYKEDTFKSQRAKGIKGVMDLPGKEKIINLSESKLLNLISSSIKNK